MIFYQSLNSNVVKIYIVVKKNSKRFLIFSQFIYCAWVDIKIFLVGTYMLSNTG